MFAMKKYQIIASLVALGSFVLSAIGNYISEKQQAEMIDEAVDERIADLCKRVDILEGR